MIAMKCAAGTTSAMTTFRPASEKGFAVVPTTSDDLGRRLPPPHCEHGLVGGHLIPLSRRTLLVVDVFDFEVANPAPSLALVTNRGFVNDARWHLYSVVSK
jgi:hypothetical protein